MDSMAKVGRVIAVAGSLETLLSLHGATGTGLREKTESLRGKLPPEASELSRRIGAVRNRVAHEPDAELSDAELAQYEETARAFAAMIEGIEPPPAAAAVVPALPSSAPLCVADDGDDGDDGDDAEDGEAEAPPPPAPPSLPRPAAIRIPFHCWCLVPGLHLLFLLAAILMSLLRAGWFELLLLLTPVGGGGIWYCWCHRETCSRSMLWTALGMLVAGYLLSAITALIEKKDHPKLWKFALVPGSHLLYLFCRILQKLRYAFLLPSLAALAAQAAAVWLVWENKEYVVAAFLTAGSILAAWLITWCWTRESRTQGRKNFL